MQFGDKLAFVGERELADPLWQLLTALWQLLTALAYSA
jgi:hypothetical protein